MRNDFLKCSNCGYDILVESALYKQIEEKVSKDRDKKDEEQLLVINRQKEQLKKEKKEYEDAKAAEEEILKKRAEELEQKEKELNKKGASSAAFNEKLSRLERESARKDKEIADLKKKEQDLSGNQEEAEIVIQKKLLEEKEKIEADTKKKEYEKYALLIKEYDRKIGDQKKAIEDLKNETEIIRQKINAEDAVAPFEERISNAFKGDSFESIEGTEGFGLVQTVKNSQDQECGKVLYEGVKEYEDLSERMNKLKEDREKTGADVAVFVSDSQPGDIQETEIMDCFIACRYGELKNITSVIRQMLIRVHGAKENEDEKNRAFIKMGVYLSGNGFRDSLLSVIAGSASVKEQINREKQALHSIWAQREKQADLITESAAEIYGCAKAVGGDRIKQIKELELQQISEKTDKKK